jgi:hypothetical protein
VTLIAFNAAAIARFSVSVPPCGRAQGMQTQKGKNLPGQSRLSLPGSGVLSFSDSTRAFARKPEPIFRNRGHTPPKGEFEATQREAGAAGKITASGAKSRLHWTQNKL